MCGIVGHIDLERPGLVGYAVSRMSLAVARRGPDAEGSAVWDGAALGHRRLAILDLSDAGRQPMLSEDRQVGVVFNGCIYNFMELRRDLQARGHRFRSHSDTEVLLHGYREWGAGALVERLRGMFAIAVWDNPRRTLTLVRDRLGVKPLVYCAQGGQIAFASTIDALRLAGFGGAMDPNAVLDVLEFGFVTENRAIWQGISKLPPATILQWHNGRISQRQYWSLPETPDLPRITFAEAVEESERRLLEAVRIRLCADVPIGVLLSGGIDSALVCWAMRLLNADVKAFTVRAPDDSSDESAAAAHTARLIGIPHEIVTMPGADFSLDELANAYSEPFTAQSAQAMLWVSRAVKRKATVLVTGDGGDDVFLGYPFFYNAWRAQKLACLLPPRAHAVARLLRKALPGRGPARRLASFLGYATGGLGEYARANDGLPYCEQRSILGERLTGVRLPQRDIPASMESARRLLSDVLAHHRRLHFTGEFMHKVDGATMHHAIEARAPFLDHQLWDFASRLPAELHFHGGRLKAVLREIARRRIGPAVAFRKKQGFTVPVEFWLARRWSGMLDRLQGATLLEREGWIRPGALAVPVRDALAKQRVPVQIWRLLVLEHWLQRVAGRFRSQPSSRGA